MHKCLKPQKIIGFRTSLFLVIHNEMLFGIYRADFAEIMINDCKSELSDFEVIGKGHLAVAKDRLVL